MKQRHVLFCIGVFLISACSETKEEKIVQNKLKKATYVGVESCRECHQQEFDRWKSSHHFEAMHDATERTVLAEWATTFEADGVSNFFFKEGDQFKLMMTEEGEVDTLTVVATFGFYPLQQYLYKGKDGRLQTLRATWDSEKNQWFNQHAGEEILRGDWLHQDGQSMTWNAMCASCHSTNLKKGYNRSTRTYNTTYSDINLTCESCHGPASLHVKQAKDEAIYSDSVSGFKPFDPGFEGQLNRCGGCHARREELYDNIQPNDKFQDSYNIAWLSDRLYFPDGQIDDEDYVLGSFLSSKMHKNGVQCINCHDAHSMKLHKEGNTLCLSCHEPQYNTSEHHFHERDTEGAQCINCHMDGKHYMGNDYRRDHSFRVPRPDQSVKYGTPNACNSCHDDKSAKWAANAIVEWYGETRPKHFSNRLLSGYMGGKLDDLVSLANDTAEPAIIRGTAIHYLAEMQTMPAQQDLENWVRDEQYLVRKAATEVIRNLPPKEKLQWMGSLFKDRAKVVRIEAIRHALDIDPNQIASAHSNAYQKAMNEYVTYLDHVADFPGGQAQRAQYYYANQQYEAAVLAYKEALRMDSLRVDFRTNLAVTYNVMGQNEKALRQLNLCLAQEENHRTYYLRGLLLAEKNEITEAAADLEKAIHLNAEISTYYYNLILMYTKLGESQKSKSLFNLAMQKFPTNQRLASLQQYVQ